MKLFLLALFFISFNVFGQASNPSNTYKIGKASSSLPKGFIFDTNDGAGNKKLTVDVITKEFTLGSTTNITGDLNAVLGTFTGSPFTMGTGLAADQKYFFDIGAGGSNPFFGWDNAIGSIVFSNDGSNPKKLGTGSGGGESGESILLNASFEDGVGSPEWLSTGVTPSSETFTDKIDGNEKFARMTFSGAGQIFESAITNKTDSLGVSCSAKIRYNGGDENIDLIVHDGSANELARATLSARSDWGETTPLQFECKSQMRLRIESTAAAAQFDLDKTYLGSVLGLINVDSLNGFSAKVNISSVVSDENSEWITGDCVSSGTANQVATCTVTGFTVTPNCQCTTGAAVSTADRPCQFAIGASTNTSLVFFQTANGSASRQDMTVSCEKAGVDSLGSSIAFLPETQNFFIDVNIGGANPTLTTTSTPLEIINGSLDMVLNKGSAQIPCSTTNSSTGLTCSSGSESLGIVFNAPTNGHYKVCATSSVTGTSNAFVRWVETPNNAQTILQQGNSGANLGNVNQTMRLCEVFTFNSSGQKTLRIMVESSAGGTFDIGRDSGVYERDMQITVEKVAQGVVRPFLLNQVSSSFTAGVKTEGCQIDNGGTPVTNVAICDTWVTSITDIAPGHSRVNFILGSFSEPPSCTCTTEDVNTCHVEQSFALIGSVQIITRNSAPVLVDSDFNLNCIGAK